MKKLYPLVLLLLLACIVQGQSNVNFNAARDNTMYSESANSNGAGDYIFAGTTAGGSIRRGLIYFDLSSIPANATISSATLVLSCNKLAASPEGLNVRRVLSNWGEGTSNANANEGAGDAATTNDATWQNRFHPATAWTNPGGDFSATLSASQANVMIGPVQLTSAQLVADVQDFVNNPNNNFGWILSGTNETGTMTAMRFGSRENPVVADRPQLMVTYDVVTPVTLINFSATLHSNNVWLKWTTANEAGNRAFEVEHSNDGRQINRLTSIAGNGTTNSTHEYSYMHQGINAGKHFYRLAQVNVNGSVTYSPVVIVSSKRFAGVEIYPNPVKDVLFLNASFLLEKLPYEIMNNAGAIVEKGVINQQQIKVNNLPAGTYHLFIYAKEGVARNILIKR